jgi:Ser/Thr protein kinase RdoA (MazF antagonist)
MELALHVLAQYPATLHGTMTPLGNHGGFSGAELFRVDAPGGGLCLRAWPASIHVVHLDQIHTWMMVAALRGLDFVPRIMATEQNSTVASAARRFWDLTTWMPGAAAPPAPQRVQNACIALARLHLAWAEPMPRRDVCPAVLRRLAAYNDWLPLIQSGWQPVIDPLDPIAPSAARAWVAVRRLLPRLPGYLLRWMAKPLPLQPCLCDIWSDHVLFVDDRVTGLVDYGSCKIDHVAVDLARLLGSMAGADPVLWSAGFNAYAQVRPLTADEQALARDLDQSGAVVAVANWLRWLVRERRTYADRATVARRLAALTERLA